MFYQLLLKTYNKTKVIKINNNKDRKSLQITMEVHKNLKFWYNL